MKGTEKLEDITKSLSEVKHDIKEFNNAIENIDEDN